MNISVIIKKIKQGITPIGDKLFELPIMEKEGKEYQLNSKMSSRNYFWFSVSSLILYPLILAALLWLVDEQKSMFQILKSQLDLWLGTSTMGIKDYVQLVGILYGSCILIYSIVSVLWIEVVIAFDTNFSKKIIKIIKVLGTIILFIILITMWGQLDITKIAVDFISDIKMPSILEKITKDTLFTTYIIKIIVLVGTPLITLINIICNLMTWLLCFSSYKFRISILFSILVVFFELTSYGIIWIISKTYSKHQKLLYNLTEFIILSCISIIFANEGKLFWISLIITIYCFYIAIKNDFDRTQMTNSFILFIGTLISNLFKNNSSNVMICDLLHLFMSMTVALYICEWFVLKVGIIGKLSEKEKNSIEDVIKNLFGGLAGSVVILIFVLVEHFL